MRKDEEWKTAFCTRYGHYKYTVIPFELTNAPANFQSLINTTFQEYLDIFVTAYFDNILINSNGTWKEHAEAVKVLKALQQADMRLRPNTCEFYKKKMKFLESIIITEGIKIDQEKVKAVTNGQNPRT